MFIYREREVCMYVCMYAYIYIYIYMLVKRSESSRDGRIGQKLSRLASWSCGEFRKARKP